MFKIYDKNYNELFEDFFDGVEPEISSTTDELEQKISGGDYILVIDLNSSQDKEKLYHIIERIDNYINHLPFKYISDKRIYLSKMKKNEYIHIDVTNDVENRTYDKGDYELLSLQYGVSGKLTRKQTERFLEFLYKPVNETISYQYVYAVMAYDSSYAPYNEFVTDSNDDYLFYLDITYDYRKYKKGERYEQIVNDVNSVYRFMEQK